MAGTHEHDIDHHVKIYMRVFGALMVLTVVTVGASYIDLGFFGNVSLALFIAMIKGGLVACYFMHLVTEKSFIFYVLGLTVFFFLFLLAIPSLWAGNGITM